MIRVLSFGLLLVFGTAAGAADWPQWLGPNRDGTSTEKVEPWKGDPKVLWRHPVGPGHSSPVVAGGTAYLFHQVAGKQEEALSAWDAVSGKALWSTPYKRNKFGTAYGTGPQATATVAGGKVYTYGASGNLARFDAKTGTIDWEFDALKRFDTRNLFFGQSTAPLLVEDRVIVQVGGKLVDKKKKLVKGPSIVAFDQADGRIAWKALEERASYAAGVVLGKKGQPDYQVVFLNQQGVRSVNPQTGEVYWKSPLVDALNESSTTPIRVGNVLLASSVTFGMVGLELTTKGGKPDAKQIWKEPKLTCYFSTPVAVGTDHVYVVTGTLPIPLVRPATASLHCVEAKSGKILWTKEKVGLYGATLLRTGNNKLLMLGDQGDLVMVDPDPKEYKELARSKVVKMDRIWAHPALSDGRLYLRDEKEILCLQLGE